MNDNEIADVFDKQNRMYFVTWFAKKLDPDIVLPSDEKTKAKALTDILYENGFCSSHQTTKFMQDNLELQPEEQLEIIHRMLYNLHILTFTEESSDSVKINYLEQIEIQKNFDMNIFPTMGPLKAITLEEKIKKLEQYEKEIRELKSAIEHFDDSECDTKPKELKCATGHFDSENKAKPKSNIYNKSLDLDAPDLLRNQIDNLMHNSMKILKERAQNDEEFFNEDFKKVVDDFAENISKFLKLCESKKLINDFSLPKDYTENSEENNACFEIIKRLALLSKEVLDMDNVPNEYQ